MVKAYLEAKDIKKLEQAAGYLRDKLLVRLLFVGDTETRLGGMGNNGLSQCRGYALILSPFRRCELLCCHG